jgi:hypothetical protein
MKSFGTLITTQSQQIKDEPLTINKILEMHNALKNIPAPTQMRIICSTRIEEGKIINLDGVSFAYLSTSLLNLEMEPRDTKETTILIHPIDFKKLIEQTRCRMILLGKFSKETGLYNLAFWNCTFKEHEQIEYPELPPFGE